MSDYSLDQAAFMRAGGQTVGEFNEAQAWRYIGHLREEVRETEMAMHQGHYVHVVDGAVDTIVVALGLLHSLGVNPDKAWDAVHAANLRKVVNGEVYRRPDGQIGHPPGWYGPEHDLARLMQEENSYEATARLESGLVPRAGGYL